MKKIPFLIATILLVGMTVCAQTTMKEYKAGHVFFVNLPDYMTKTTNLNDAASIQFINNVKDIAGYIIFDTKEELELVNMKFSNATEFYETFIKDFLVKQKNRKVSEPQIKSMNGNNYVESDVTYLDKESKMEIYFYIGIVETKNSFYKLLCYGGIDSKEKYRSDFQAILYSLKE
jgi:hypothetical protein